MEVKNWSYKDFPSYNTEIPDVRRIATTGEEIGVSYIPDVVYETVDGLDLHLQILQPRSRNHPAMISPCIIFVQGSAWMKQDCYFALPDIARIAARGFVVAIVEYRHSGIAAFPAQILDARNAVRYMRKHAAQYRLDPNRIFLSGSSSGGHTAVFAGIEDFEQDSENRYPGVSAKVSGIIDFYGSTSVMADDSNPCTVNHCQPDSPEGMVMGFRDLNDDPELKRQLSAECHITDETQIAPLLIIHGTKDRTVNCEGSVILYHTMKEHGKDVELLLVEGADHGGPEFTKPEVLDVIQDFTMRVTR